ncbi:histidine--tRNA ligase [Candidatus Woesearchaeota archaeon]|nr:histidine--tRNA ligase [Candidatus Woesearchaeota archaeon]
MKLQNPRGMRDLSPEESIFRNQIIGVIKTAFENYGFSPLGTPLIERFEILSAKYAGGEEILKETFKLKDQGKRQLGLRYDLTVPLARYIGMNQQIKLPFKRYQIGTVYRDGPIKLGRAREFIQCDADIIGSASVLADAELLILAARIFERLGLKVKIKLNSRKILDAIMEALDIPEKDKIEFILSLDKLDKIGANGVREDLKKKGIKEYDEIKPLLSTIKTNSPDELKKNVSKLFAKNNKKFENTEYEKGFVDICEILSYLKGIGIKNIEFSGALARGLTYYTGAVFEVFLKNSEVKSSVAGGGRYDEMIGKFLEGKNYYPATGISFGLEPIIKALKIDKKEAKKTVTQVYIIPINALKESLDIAEKLRKENLNVDIAFDKKGVSKGLDYANSLSIPYVIIIGEDELKKNKIKLKDMKTGKERLLNSNDIVKIVENEKKSKDI